MTEAGLKLALVADGTESLAFAWRQSKVNLHADSVHEKREPTGHAKVQTKGGSDLCFAVEFALIATRPSVVPLRATHCGKLASNVSRLFWRKEISDQGIAR